MSETIAFIATTESQPETVLHSLERYFIQGTLSRRQEEFAAGRWCARKAMEKLGMEGGKAILRGESGEPLWPNGVVGSIAHSMGPHGARKIFCAAAALEEGYSSMGLDVEPLSKKISSEAFSVIANDDELEWIESHQIDNDFTKLLIFSAKESLFKLLYPLIKKRFYFNAVSIFPASTQCRSGEFTVRLKKTLHRKFKKDLILDGVYFSNKEWLFTFCALGNKKSA